MKPSKYWITQLVHPQRVDQLGCPLKAQKLKQLCLLGPWKPQTGPRIGHQKVESTRFALGHSSHLLGFHRRERPPEPSRRLEVVLPKVAQAPHEEPRGRPRSRFGPPRSSKPYCAAVVLRGRGSPDVPSHTAIQRVEKSWMDEAIQKKDKPRLGGKSINRWPWRQPAPPGIVDQNN